MRLKLIFLLSLLILGTALAQETVATLTMTLSTNSPDGLRTFDLGTNDVATLQGDLNQSAIYLSVNGTEHFLRDSTFTVPATVVAGPGTIVWRGHVDYNFNLPPPYAPRLCALTIAVTNDYTPPEKTLIIPAESKGATVALQLSTDLLNWTTITNGTFYPSNTAHFFRINLDRVP